VFRSLTSDRDRRPTSIDDAMAMVLADLSAAWPGISDPAIANGPVVSGGPQLGAGSALGAAAAGGGVVAAGLAGRRHGG